MKKLILAFVFLVTTLVFQACHRETCPAYQSGSVTGIEGTKSKKTQELLPKKMRKNF
jgi:hypothetical protein